MSSTRDQAIGAARAQLDDGTLFARLAERVAIPTDSTDPRFAPDIRRYFRESIAPEIEGMGFSWSIEENPASVDHPMMIARRREAAPAFTVLMYGHADVQPPQTEQWSDGLDPWTLTAVGERWYGRGSADNKAQHTVNLAALAAVIAAADGDLGYDVTLLLESGEEFGSPGLEEFCSLHADELAADVFIASDGPRMNAATPTIFLGSRGTSIFRLDVEEREGAHHSGNWGGVLANAGTILANALASLVDGRGRLQVPELVPDDIPESVRTAVSRLSVGSDPGDPELSADWGEPGLSPAERLFAWNTLEILDFHCGTPASPVGAIPGAAFADLQLRYVAGSVDPDAVIPAIRARLDAEGFERVRLTERGHMAATRLDPADPWAVTAAQSLAATTGKETAIVPNLAGTIPNRAFAGVLGLPTVWVPHSYPGCQQHAPDEHVLEPVLREGLEVVAGLLWDLRAGRPDIVAD